MFDKNLFSITFFSLFIIEIFSFVAHFFPVFNYLGFTIIILLTLLLSLEKIEYGLYIIWAELLIDSFGYLFSLPLSGINFSLRMGLFVTVFSVGVYNIIKNKDYSFLRFSFLKYCLIFFLFLLWGVINGYINNDLSNLFFDFNGFVFYALLPIFFISLKELKQFWELLSVVSAALLASIVKTLFTLYIFSHDIYPFISQVYSWIRDTRVGEITRMSDNFYRIFFQSHIFVGVAIILLGSILARYYLFFSKKLWNQVKFWKLYLLFIFSLSVILVSMSRSLWVGTIFSVSLLIVCLSLMYKNHFKNFLKLSLFYFISLLFAILLILAIIKFPVPRQNNSLINTVTVFEQRSVNIKGEAAVSSRWALLAKLWESIREYPLLGKGFGTLVTYKSSDPRIVNSSAGGKGLYKTFAFEWGYLDIWLKIGLLGLLAYLALLFNILYRGILSIDWKLIKKHNTNDNLFNLFKIGLLLGGVLIGIVHIFTPYLNHPLGISYVMLLSVLINNIFNKKTLLKRR